MSLLAPIARAVAAGALAVAASGSGVPAALSGASPRSSASAHGPFDIPLFNTPKAPDARGAARLVYAPSPFGVAVTADGHARYDVQVDVTGLKIRPVTELEVRSDQEDGRPELSEAERVAGRRPRPGGGQWLGIPASGQM